MQTQGKIKIINETQSFGTNGFRKRETVITTDEQYPQNILIEFVQDKCDLLDEYAIGDNVIIGINLRGREWVSPQGETKYFNTIQDWRIEKASTENTSQQASSAASELNNQEEDHDDLPFLKK